MNIKSPISKLLFSINNSFSGYLIYFYYKFFDRAREANVHEIKPQRLHSQKVLIVNEEPDGIDTNDIGNSEELLWIVFTKEAYVSLKLVTDGGELTKIITQRVRSDLYRPKDVHSVTNAAAESSSSISKLNIVNHLGKHDFSCG